MSNSRVMPPTVHRPAPDRVLPSMFDRYRLYLEGRHGGCRPSARPDTLSTPCCVTHLGWSDQHGAPSPTPASQGKALRPTLCMFACEAFDGQLTDAAPAAAALELIHNFSLIHDDIQDRGYERRHQPTVWAVWGTSPALVAGDSMQSLGDYTSILATDSVSPSTAIRVSGSDHRELSGDDRRPMPGFAVRAARNYQNRRISRYDRPENRRPDS